MSALPEGREGPEAVPVTVIEPVSATGRLPVAEIWANRRFLVLMVRRAVQARYKDTFLGVFWAIAQPLSYMLVLNLFFGVVARFSAPDIPYPLFLFCGLVPYQFFSRCAVEGAASIRGNAELVNKVYVPRMLLPLSTVGTIMVDFLVAFGLLVLMALFYQVAPTMNLIALPLLFLLLFAAGVSMAIGLSVATVYYHDLRVGVPVVMQMWFFATPIIYPASRVPEAWQVWYGLNPMVSVVELFRWCLLGTASLPDTRVLAVSVATILTVLLISLHFFRKLESNVADRV
ncbi:MAG: ABC transporter permease [Gammaproteobacteria bacterium]